MKMQSLCSPVCLDYLVKDTCTDLMSHSLVEATAEE